jgi:hypothetical protein
MAGPSPAPYTWTVHKISLTYVVAQSVSDFGNDDILREDNICVLFFSETSYHSHEISRISEFIIDVVLNYFYRNSRQTRS